MYSDIQSNIGFVLNISFINCEFVLRIFVVSKIAVNVLNHQPKLLNGANGFKGKKTQRTQHSNDIA